MRRLGFGTYNQKSHEARAHLHVYYRRGNGILFLFNFLGSEAYAAFLQLFAVGSASSSFGLLSFGGR